MVDSATPVHEMRKKQLTPPTPSPRPEAGVKVCSLRSWDYSASNGVFHFVKWIVALSFAVTLSACGGAAPPSANLQLIDNARQSGQPTVVEFGSDSCASCRRMKIVMDAVARRVQGQGHVLVMDVIKDASLQKPYRIQMIPTQVFFDARGNEVTRHMGPLTEAQVLERLGLAQ